MGVYFPGDVVLWVLWKLRLLIPFGIFFFVNKMTAGAIATITESHNY